MEENLTGTIYFLEAVGQDLIKIGFSKSMKERMAKISAMSPLPLALLKTVRGTIQTEQALLAVFQKYNAHHEWFRASPNLRTFIDALKEGQAFSPEMIFSLRK